MSIIELHQDHYFIDRKHFLICVIDGKTRKEITNLYPLRSQGIYYIDKFINYLKDTHGLTVSEYFEKFFSVDWPKCPVKNKKCGTKSKGSGLRISKYAPGGTTKESCPAFAKGCEKISKERMGSGNPMWGKEAWNKNIDPNHPWVEETKARMKNRVVEDSTRQKLREAIMNSPIKARHITPHTEGSKQKMRDATIARIVRGDFYNIRSKIQVKVFEFLEKNFEDFKEEYPIDVFLVDFAFEKNKIAIEVQGSYFHSDKRLYPNGPITKTQKRNWYRDKKKKILLEEKGWTLIEIWESEINSGEFEEILKCKLKELLE